MSQYMDILNLIFLFVAAFIAGGVNAVAGGGTIFSFSALSFSFPMVNANATNAAALWPGSLSSAYAYRKELSANKRLFVILLVPTVLGALAGAVLLVNTSESIFRRLVPFLVLFALFLFAFKDQIMRVVRQGKAIPIVNGEPVLSPLAYVWGVCFQFFIALYGGYFGAGMGILSLSSFGLMGLRDIHKMNALKNPLVVFINLLATFYFLADGKVIIPMAILMGIGALIGGYVAARLSKRISQSALRTFVIVMGLCVTAWLFYRSIPFWQ